MPQLHLIPLITELDASLELAKKHSAAFEYNDFFLPDILDNQEAIAEKIAIYRDLGRDTSLDTMHGAFLDVTLHSSDSRIRETSEYRVYQSLDIASRLGCKGVIFHTNFIPNFNTPSYIEQWITLNETFYRSAMHKYPNIHIYVENMFDTTPFLLQQLAARMTDCPNFGVCLDVAHAHLSEHPLVDWLESLAPYIRHMHINDNSKDMDSHDTIGSGTIDWAMYTKLIETYRIQPSVLIEITTLEKQIKSLAYMQHNNIFPFL